MTHVAIVGAGIGGIYTGWRLRQAGYDVTIYEGSERVGGRLLTWFPNYPDRTVRGELGGMRFIPKQHQMVARLVRTLGLQPQSFPATAELWYLRDTYVKDFSDPAQVPYQLRPGEQGKSPDQLLKLVINEVARVNEIPDPFALTREKWDAIKPNLKWKGEPLSHFGFWNVTLDIVSAEAYSLITDGLGYYSLTSNWNAAEAMQFIATDFASDEYDTLMEGYSALATRLAGQFVASGGRVRTRSRVTRMDRVGRGWQLQFGNGATEQADVALLGLPGRAMELIAFPPEVEQKLAGLQSAVIRVPAFKLFLLYAQNWWPFGKGRTITDLPLRQTYNFNVVDSQRSFMAMASYDDLTAVPYWHGLEREVHPDVLTAEARELFHPARFSGVPEGEEPTDQPPGFTPASPPMLSRAQEQLRLSSGLSQIPLPAASAYMDWNQDPYGGGWSFWAPGTNVPRVMTDMRYLADNLFVVGDSFSGIQGWVEGALTYAEKLLQGEPFKLPAFLPGYYVGH